MNIKGKSGIIILLIIITAIAILKGNTLYSLGSPSACMGKGLYILGGPSSSTSPTAYYNATQLKYLTGDTRICGIALKLAWSNIEPSNGTYNWSFIDQAAAPWVANGMKVGIIIYGQEAPQFVMNQAGTVACAGKKIAPIYWHPGFINNYDTFLSALFSHYGGNPSISYYRIRLGDDIGAYSTSDATCIQLWASAGYTTSLWQNYTNSLLSFIVSANPNRVVGLGGISGSPDAAAVKTSVWSKGTSLGFIIGNEGVSLRDIPIANCNLCLAAQQYHTNIWVQTLTTTVGNPTTTGTSDVLIPYFLNNSAIIFEWYPIDLLAADNPNSSYYPTYQVAYNKAYTQLATALGSRASGTTTTVGTSITTTSTTTSIPITGTTTSTTTTSTIPATSTTSTSTTTTSTTISSGGGGGGGGGGGSALPLTNQTCTTNPYGSITCTTKAPSTNSTNLTSTNSTVSNSITALVSSISVAINNLISQILRIIGIPH